MRGLIEGEWRRRGAPDEAAVFARDGYRGWIPSARFPAEAGRYHLYVSYACPFAHRVILAHRLKGLDDVVTMSVCDPYLGGPNGWWFATSDSLSAFAEVTSDTVNGRRYLHEIYTLANPTYTGRVTVPVLGTAMSEPSSAPIPPTCCVFSIRPSLD